MRRRTGVTPPTVPALVPLLAVAALLVGACGSSTSSAPGVGATSATPGGSTSAIATPVAAVPPARDPVTGVGTVISVGEATPELCLGPVRESFPPQCDGVPLVGWSWAEHPPEQSTDTGGATTSWGSYAVTGTFDGRTLAVDSAVPLALYDTVADPSPRPMAPPDLTDAQWERVESGVRLLPGLLTSGRQDASGPVYVDVVHDDGTLQAWADSTFGVGAVRVTSMLRSR